MPYPSNDIKKKTMEEMIELATKKLKESKGMMAQMAAEKKAKALKDGSKKKKTVKLKEVKIWQRQPNGGELREMAELTETFEDAGMIVRNGVMRKVVVNDHEPEYVY